MTNGFSRERLSTSSIDEYYNDTEDSRCYRALYQNKKAGNGI